MNAQEKARLEELKSDGREILVCRDNASASQRWAGLVVSPTGERDGNSITVEVVVTSPSFPKWHMGRKGPMSFTAYKHYGGSALSESGRKAGASKTVYTDEEIFGA